MYTPNSGKGVGRPQVHIFNRYISICVCKEEYSRWFTVMVRFNCPLTTILCHWERGLNAELSGWGWSEAMCSSFVSVTVSKYPDQNQLRGVKDIFHLTVLDLHWEKLRQELESRQACLLCHVTSCHSQPGTSHRHVDEWCLRTHAQTHAQPAIIHSTGPSAQRTVPPAVSWNHLHQ